MDPIVYMNIFDQLHQLFLVFLGLEKQSFEEGLSGVFDMFLVDKILNVDIDAVHYVRNISQLFDIVFVLWF